MDHLKPKLLLIVMSVISSELFTVLNGSPSPQVKCKAAEREFFDDVAMTRHNCSVCFAREGSMFWTKCVSVCKCYKAVITRTTPRVSRVPPTVSMSTEDTAPPGTITLTTTPTKQATLVPTNIVVEYQERKEGFNFSAILIPVSMALMVVFLLGLAIFCLCRRNRRRRSTTQERVHKGCFERIVKVSIPETGQGETSYTEDQGHVRSKEPNHVTGRAPTFPPSSGCDAGMMG
ncbi:uncharacterized protein LOC116302437 [Actinia tenebrosa]|uniref:Uncharacterized protein LOC116302437 n=1 Tax=Actinia tenebrosa TaxID=6105 RepID=A0A6P8IKU5_ACTTE|nr:uncharacterized protein LOC116302437 [Actinia tenebrosa]